MAYTNGKSVGVTRLDDKDKSFLREFEVGADAGKVLAVGFCCAQKWLVAFTATSVVWWKASEE